MHVHTRVAARAAVVCMYPGGRVAVAGMYPGGRVAVACMYPGGRVAVACMYPGGCSMHVPVQLMNSLNSDL